MINRNLLTDLLQVLAYILIQIFIMNRLDGIFWGYIPVIYPCFILFYPFHRNVYQFLILSFILGLGIDAFMGIWGVNAFASVCLAYFRTLIFRSATETSQRTNYFSFQSLQWSQFIFFIFSGVFIDQLIIYTLEFFKFSQLLQLLLDIGISTLISFIFVLFFALLFKIKQRN